MSILTLQRRLREAGRIRIGHKVPTRDGGQRPAKLETFRLTSRDRRAIEEAASKWGGKVTPWQSPAGQQWEVVTEADELPVLVPPTDMAFDQWFEQWTAAGCKVRCDGERDLIGDAPCSCDPTDRACDIHSRLSVMLPLSGIGLWRLETQGFYAGTELAGVVELLISAAMQGQRLPARLRLEQRTAKRVAPNGDPVTLRYVVPVLDVELDLFALTVGGGAPAVGRGTSEGTEALTPVPSLTPSAAELAEVFRPSVAEQMAAVDEEPPEALTRRRVTPPPTTGMVPRTAMEAAAVERAHATENGPLLLMLRTAVNSLGKEGRAAFLDRFGAAPQDLPPSVLPEAKEYVDQMVAERAGRVPPSPPASVPPASSPTPEAGGATQTEPSDVAAPSVASVATKARHVFQGPYDAAPRGEKTRVLEELRHALVYASTDAKTSLTQCTPGELLKVWQRLEDIAAGRMTFTYDRSPDAGVRFTYESGTEAYVLWSELEDAAD